MIPRRSLWGRLSGGAGAFACQASSPLLTFTLAAACLQLLHAQPGRGPATPPASAKAAAPVDLTGYWVSPVMEDYRWRMVTPLKGDAASVPINDAARKIVDAWDPAKDEAAGLACKAYGAPALMRIPGRLHITWQDDDTLKIETDAGTQTRLFHFGGTTPNRRTRFSWNQPRRRQVPLARSHHHQTSPRLPAKEWRALQRAHHAHRILRSLHRAQWRRVVHRHHHCDRPGISFGPIRHHHRLPQRAGWFALHALALHGEVVGPGSSTAQRNSLPKCFGQVPAVMNTDIGTAG